MGKNNQGNVCVSCQSIFSKVHINYQDIQLNKLLILKLSKLIEEFFGILRPPNWRYVLLICTFVNHGLEKYSRVYLKFGHAILSFIIQIYSNWVRGLTQQAISSFLSLNDEIMLNISLLIIFLYEVVSSVFSRRWKIMN